MSNEYEISFISSSCQKEYLSLSGQSRMIVDKGLARLRIRPLDIGKPLSGVLLGCRELKFRADGIRVIYRVVENEIKIVQIVAIGPRDKGKAFRRAEQRMKEST